MTVNLPGKLTQLFNAQIKEHLYLGAGDYCIGLVVWDVYSRQKHARTGPLMRMPSWAVDNFVDDLLTSVGSAPLPGALKPSRFTVRLPDLLYPLAVARKAEELYRSMPSYMTGLILFALDPLVPDGKGIPHHKLAPMLQKPKWVRDAVFSKIAEDFGNPERKWPIGLGDKIDEIVDEQRQLHLGPERSPNRGNGQERRTED